MMTMMVFVVVVVSILHLQLDYLLRKRMLHFQRINYSSICGLIPQVNFVHGKSRVNINYGKFQVKWSDGRKMLVKWSRTGEREGRESMKRKSYLLDQTTWRKWDSWFSISSLWHIADIEFKETETRSRFWSSSLRSAGDGKLNELTLKLLWQSRPLG